MKRILLGFMLMLSASVAFGQVNINRPQKWFDIIAAAGDVTPTELAASQNNYNPTSLGTSNVLRLTAGAAYNITGLAGGSDGRLIFIYNAGSFTITLKDNSGSSSAANRFALSADIAIPTDEGVLLIYDGTASLWRCVYTSQSGGVVASTQITDFAEAVDDRVNTLVTDGDGITTTYNDGAGTLEFAYNLKGEELIGTLTSADLNVDTDQSITINATNYIITKIVFTNASVDLTASATAGGIYTAATKGGIDIVAATQGYTGLTAATKYISATLEAEAGTDRFTGGTIYLSLTTPHGVAATADVYVYGYVIAR